jgi:hypothetical protein
MSIWYWGGVWLVAVLVSAIVRIWGVGVLRFTATTTLPQYHIDISSGFVMHKGIPIAIVRLRHKKAVRHKNCRTICTSSS